MSEAHDVSGKVEIILKNEKKKTDLSPVIIYLNQVGTLGMITARKPYEIAFPPQVEGFLKSVRSLPRAVSFPLIRWFTRKMGA